MPNASQTSPWRIPTRWAGGLALTALSLLTWHQDVMALPAFARQTGQSCVACHAGGQFPELTPYGRMFKLTGYTLGEHANPLSVMAAASVSRLANPDGINASLNANASGAALQLPLLNNTLKLDQVSVFLAGKITDNIGAFTQISHDPYANPNASGEYRLGHSGVDNVDLRFADHFLSPQGDFLWGVSVNNNPSVSDPWNTAWAWSQYVPSSGGPGANTYLDAHAPYPNSALPGDHYAGINVYMYIHQSVYAEWGMYRSPAGRLHFLNTGYEPTNSILKSSNNPYWRFAYTKEWGAHTLMLGTMGVLAHPFDSNFGVSTSDAQSYQLVRSQGLDAQYQYLLDPHALTIQWSNQQQRLSPSAADALSNGTPLSATGIMRAKASYVFNARYGLSASTFSQSGDFSSNTQGNTLELFFMPIQNLRLGLQLTTYNRLANIDKPSDANTVNFYAWSAF